jgi:hypothetical protein
MPTEMDHLQRRADRKPRALTAADLRWYFCESESAMGVRSTHEAFVDMAQSGPPSGGGGRLNGVEATMLRRLRLFGDKGRDVIADHRRIHALLLGKGAQHLAVVEAAYGPDNWCRRLPTPIRVAVCGLFGETAAMAADSGLVQIAPMTTLARAAAAKKQAPLAPSADPEAVYDAWAIVACDIATREEIVHQSGLRCVYRPADPPAPPPKKKADDKAKKLTPADVRAAAKTDLFRRDPALAGSPRGAVIDVACCEDKARRQALVTETRALLMAAHKALGLMPDPRPSGKVKAVRREVPAAVFTFASEVL